MPPLVTASNFKFLLSQAIIALDPGGALSPDYWVSKLSGFMMPGTSPAVQNSGLDAEKIWSGSSYAYSDMLSDVAVDFNGNVYAIGYGQTYQNAGSSEAIIAKYTNSASPVWEKRISLATSTYGLSIAVDSDANIYVVYATGNSSAHVSQVVLSKFNTDGVQQWSVQNTLGNVDSYTYLIGSIPLPRVEVVADSVILSYSAIYNVAAYGAYTAYLTTGSVIVKYTRAGKPIWSSTTSPVRAMSAGYIRVTGKDVCVASDGQYCHAVNINTQGSLRKYTSADVLSWYQTFNFPISGVCFDSQSNVILVGTRYISSTQATICTVKLDSAGNRLWSKEAASYDQGTVNSYNDALSVGVDATGTIHVAGTSTCVLANAESLVVLRYSSDGILLGQNSLLGMNNSSPGHVRVGAGNALYIPGAIAELDSADFYKLRPQNAMLLKLPLDTSRTSELPGIIYQSMPLLASSDIPGVLDYFDYSFYTVSTGTGSAIGGGVNASTLAMTLVDIPINSATNAGSIMKVAVANQYAAVNSDSLGNAYAIILDGSTSYAAYLVKFNPSGQVVWYHGVGTSSTARFFPMDVCVDSVGDVYVSGRMQNAGLTTAALLKYSGTDGTILWKKHLNTGSIASEALSVAVDASGNVHIDIIYDPSGATLALYYLKLSSSGALVNRSNTTIFGPARLVSDAAGNMYRCTHQSSIGSWIGKSSGAAYDGWDVGISNAYAYDNALDASGNLYVTGYMKSTTVTVPKAMFVAKFDTTGTLVWQVSLKDANDVIGFGIAVDSSSNVYVAATGVLFKFTSDGTQVWAKSASFSTGGRVRVCIQGTYIWLAPSSGGSIYKYDSVNPSLSDAVGYIDSGFRATFTNYNSTHTWNASTTSATDSTLPDYSTPGTYEILDITIGLNSTSTVLSGPAVTSNGWYVGITSSTFDYSSSQQTLISTPNAAPAANSWYDTFAGYAVTVDYAVNQPTLITGTTPAANSWYDTFAGYAVTVDQTTNNVTLQAI